MTRPASRIVLLLALTAASGGCGSPTGSAPLPPLDCADPPNAGAIVEITSSLRQPRQVLGRCGSLHYLDEDDNLHAEGPALVASTEVAVDVADYRVSSRGDQRLILREGEAQWQGPDGASSEWVAAEAAGFVRAGEAERAWICGDNRLARLGADGVQQLVDDVILCPAVTAAPSAPRLAFVGRDTTLRVLNVETGAVLDLSEVPYIAASTDQIVFSDDGLFLFHGARRAATPRIGIFDLRLAEGSRFVAAPESPSGVNGLVRAPRQGHVLAFRVNNGLMVLTSDGFLNFYEAAELVAFGPDGEHALLSFAPFSPRTTYDYEVADFAALSLERVAELNESPSRVLVSPDAARVLLQVERGLLEWSWEEQTMNGRSAPGELSGLSWFGADGSFLMQTPLGDVVRVGPDGREQGRVEGFVSSVASVRGGRDALANVQRRDGAEAALVIFGQGEPEVLYEALGLQAPQVDEAGERLSVVTIELDPDDPTRSLFRLLAGAVP